VMGVEEVTSGQTQTEPQSLPAGWARATIGDILTLEYGKSLVKANRAESGAYPVYGSSGVVGFHTEYLIKQPAIIVGRKGAAGAVHLCKKDFWPIDTTYFVKVNNSLSTDFIFYLLKFCRLQKYESSTAIPGLNRDHAYAEKISLPPLAEQQRIVTRIEELFSELDKGVENLRTAQQQLKVYRQALLKHAFEGKLTADWRAQNPDKLEAADALLARIQQEREARYQQQLQEWEANGRAGSKPKKPKALPPLTGEELADLPELPHGWINVKAEAICDFITKGTTPSKELLFDGGGEVPFIKVYNLTKNGSLDFTISPTFVSQETHNGFLARSKVYPGDVLMNIVGPPLGKVSIVPDHHPEWNINQAIAIFRTSLLKSNVLAAILASETTVRKTMPKSKATAGQFNLTLEICREIIVPVCSISEQIKLAQELEEKSSILDQLEQTITHSLQQAEALRQSILKKAFSGQLVLQDPNDEPASILLERIRAERAAQPKARGRKAKASV
jgi:type I restriction enzyme S subunit